ncbi:doc protein [Vibrio cholerae]|nr:doc protein [Vibrio cholerae]
MDIICFPFERVIEINAFILKTEPGMKGAVDIPKLQGALGRIDNAIVYEGLDDVFEIAAKYTACIAVSHALPDANKRTGLAVALEYLSLNHNTQKNKIQLSKHNKRFKRDSQRVAFLLCVGLCDYGVMRKVCSSVVCPLSGRYANPSYDMRSK